MFNCFNTGFYRLQPFIDVAICLSSYSLAEPDYFISLGLRGDLVGRCSPSTREVFCYRYRLKVSIRGFVAYENVLAGSGAISSSSIDFCDWIMRRAPWILSEQLG